MDRGPKATFSNYYDISPVIDHNMSVFPGDIPFKRSISMSFEKDDHLTLSSIQTTLHIGSHTDAPIHYHPDGKGMSEVSLDFYLGPCQVIAAQNATNGVITKNDIDFDQIKSKRLLFKTESFPDHQKWTNDFWGIDPLLIKSLAQKNICLIGIDTPSIDPATSKDLPSHHQVYQHNLAILEGITLVGVPPGHYDLIALPLKIRGADASPVRAILRPIDESFK